MSAEAPFDNPASESTIVSQQQHETHAANWKLRIVGIAAIAATAVLAPVVADGMHDSARASMSASTRLGDPSPTGGFANPQTGHSTEHSFTLATYNILGANHGNSKHNRLPLFARMKLVARIIKGAAGGPRMNAVAIQEAVPAQARMLQQDLPGYSISPKPGKGYENYILSDNSVFLKRRSAKVPYWFYGSSPGHLTGEGAEVDLVQRSTGREVDLSGQQLPAWAAAPGTNPPGVDVGGGLQRRNGAIAQRNWAELKQRQNSRAIYAVLQDSNGGWNLRTIDTPAPNANYSGARTRKDTALKSKYETVYCEDTALPSVLQDAKDAARGLYGHCPDFNDISGNLKFTEDDLTNYSTNAQENGVNVDTVSISPETALVTHWLKEATSATKEASDHLPVIATVVGK